MYTQKNDEFSEGKPNVKWVERKVYAFNPIMNVVGFKQFIYFITCQIYKSDEPTESLMSN